MPHVPPRVPRYRRHSSGQARVTLDGKDHLLGKFGSPESHEAYRRVVAEWLEAPGRQTGAPARPEITITYLGRAYFKFAEQYYGFDQDRGRGDRYCLLDALRVMKHLYGSTAAKDFGPLALKSCRSAMIAKGWSRSYINAQVGRLKRIFRWATEEELIPGATYQNLAAVAGLRRGKGSPRETTGVRPVPAEVVERTLPFLSTAVRAMVQFQVLTACRPAEVCLVRPMDIDMADARCWIYRPQSHKTQHHGFDRTVFIGPRAREILRPFLNVPPDAFCFCPALAEAARNEGRRSSLDSSISRVGVRARKQSVQSRAPGDRYDTHAYRRAITRACDRAFPPPPHLVVATPPKDREIDCRAISMSRQLLTAETREWHKKHRWHPNQLRHSRATELRTYGLDVAKTVLGHAKVETTQIYAEKDLRAAVALVAEIG